MLKTMTITIPEPCAQNWDTMEERSIGRHCNSCNKTVVDFTNFTDEQLISFFQRLTANVCGRIENDRINVPLALPPLPKRNRIQWLYPLTAILSLFGFNMANAQIADTSSSKSHTQNSVEKTIFEKEDSTGKVRQLYIEILLSGPDGSVLTDRKFDIKCMGIDSLKFTLEKGLIKLPTDQFSKDSMEIIISDANHYASVIVSPYSLARYYVVPSLRDVKSKFKLLCIPGKVMGTFSAKTSSVVRASYEFQRHTLNEKIRYQQNQY